MESAIKKSLPAAMRAPSFLSAFFGRFTRVEQPESLKVMGSVMLGPKDRVCVLEIGESWVVVGSGSNGLTTLAQLHRGGRPLTEKSSVLPSALELGVEQRGMIAGLVQDVGKGSEAESEAQEIAVTLQMPERQPEAQHVDFEAVMAEERASAAIEQEGVSPMADERLVDAVVEQEVVAADAQVEVEVMRDEDGFPDPVEALRAVESEVDAVAVDQAPAIDSAKSFVNEPVVNKSFAQAFAAEDSAPAAVPAASKKSFLSIYSETKAQGK